MSFTESSIQIPIPPTSGPLLRALLYTISGNNVLAHTFVLQDANTPTNLSAITTNGEVYASLRNVGLTANAPNNTSVGTSTGQVVAPNTSRKGFVCTNLSSNTIFLAFGTAALANKGITILPQATFEMDHWTLHTGAINAIASGSSSTLSYQEFQ